jgi:hypothetical protein
MRSLFNAAAIYAFYAVTFHLNERLSAAPSLTLTLLIFLTFARSYLNLSQIKSDLRFKRRHGKAGYIYSFFDVGNIVPAIKIGRETNADERLRSHRTAAPLGIVTVSHFKVRDAVYAEAYLFNRYKHLRLHPRREWFFVTLDMLWTLILLSFDK